MNATQLFRLFNPRLYIAIRGFAFVCIGATLGGAIALPAGVVTGVLQGLILSLVSHTDWGVALFYTFMGGAVGGAASVQPGMACGALMFPLIQIVLANRVAVLGCTEPREFARRIDFFAGVNAAARGSFQGALLGALAGTLCGFLQSRLVGHSNQAALEAALQPLGGGYYYGAVLGFAVGFLVVGLTDAVGGGGNGVIRFRLRPPFRR